MINVGVVLVSGQVAHKSEILRILFAQGFHMAYLFNIASSPPPVYHLGNYQTCQQALRTARKLGTWGGVVVKALRY